MAEPGGGLALEGGAMPRQSCHDIAVVILLPRSSEMAGDRCVEPDRTSGNLRSNRSRDSGREALAQALNGVGVAHGSTGGSQ